MKVITRQDCADSLPDGSDQLVIDLHIAATAAIRHQSRVAAVRAAALAYLAAPKCYIEITDRTVGTLCQLELGGIGGRGGYHGDRPLILGAMGFRGDAGGASFPSTARMSWCNSRSGLGSGRRHATDGMAWDRAIKEVSEGSGPVTPDSIRDIMLAIVGDDLAWPLSHALHCALRDSGDVAAAGAWAALARDLAARTEPDSAGGKLAQRYSLPTLDPKYTFHGRLTAEVIASMVGLSEEDLIAALVVRNTDIVDDIGVPHVDVRIDVAGELCVSDSIPDDRLFPVTVSTRDPRGASAAMGRAQQSAGLSLWLEAPAEVKRMINDLHSWTAPDPNPELVK